MISGNFKENSPRISLGFFIGKNNFADMKKNVSLLSQTNSSGKIQI